MERIIMLALVGRFIMAPVSDFSVTNTQATRSWGLAAVSFMLDTQAPQ
jgi:hypothetical protein